MQATKGPSGLVDIAGKSSHLRATKSEFYILAKVGGLEREEDLSPPLLLPCCRFAFGSCRPRHPSGITGRAHTPPPRGLEPRPREPRPPLPLGGVVAGKPPAST